MTILGQLALGLGFLLAIWGTVVGAIAGQTGRPALVQSARRAVFALAGVMGVAALALVVALLGRDFNVAYVWSYTSRQLPTVYTLSAFYGGQAGSLLFWALILTAFAAAAQWLTSSRYAKLLPYVGAVTSFVALFFISTILFSANPFERLPFTPVDGNGLNPQLQNPGMAIHPPMLYLGFVSITIPFAFAVAALLTRQRDAAWIHAVRKWTLVSWIFLSIGITLGMWWAYVELGWGGYWAWDPVENASFLPWLTMTAFLHSVMIQEKRGMLRKWNVVLIALSFMLSIFGTFITRSGIISSVHSFTQSDLGYFFLVFLVIAAVFLVWLFATRLPLLRSEGHLESMVSREATFLFNNLLLVGMAFAILWGTIFPIISELIRGTQVTVGPPFFNRVTTPIGLALLGLTGIGPLIAWRKASISNLKRQFAVPVAVAAACGLLLIGVQFGSFYAGMAVTLGLFVTVAVLQEFSRGVGARHRLHGESYGLALARLFGRNRRRYGGYVVHLGIVAYFVGFSGMAFRRDLQVTLQPGETATLSSPFGYEYTLTHMGVSQFKSVNRWVTAATVSVTRGGEDIGMIRSEKRQHFSCQVAVAPCPNGMETPTFQPSTEAGIRSDYREDMYVVFAGAIEGTETAVYRFTLTPLVWWIWMGGAILVAGGVIVMWPGGGPTRRAPRRAIAGYSVRLVGEAQTTSVS
ncbi:MAG: heme lyase CcmF/NrfE family subunit [Gemmatimonadetes bacterium]|nr:heme lyase CcmF/NrfE family subunit [Gemmatimonadota bacterium]